MKYDREKWRMEISVRKLLFVKAECYLEAACTPNETAFDCEYKAYKLHIHSQMHSFISFHYSLLSSI